MTKCDECWHNYYDEESDQSFCSKDIDEDEWYRIRTQHKGECPFFRPADDYELPRHQ